MSSIKFGTLVSVALAASLITSEPALAKSKAEAWAAWMARAQMIDDALNSNPDGTMPIEAYKDRVSSACKGVTGTVIGQGMAFPGWGQKLIPLCRALDGGFFSGSRGKRCGDLKSAGKALVNAGPVAEVPEAQTVAQRLGSDVLAFQRSGCG